MMELLLWFSGVYIIYCILSIIGLWKKNKESNFQIDIMVTSAFGFFLLAGFSNMKGLTKGSLGILCVI